MNVTRLLTHTAVVERYSGTVNAAGDILYDDDGEWSVQGTIDCRRLTTRAAGADNQQVMEADGNIRRKQYPVYVLPSADVVFGDRLVNISTKKTGGDGWGEAATVLDTGPLNVVSVINTVDRGFNLKVLEAERVT